MSLLMADAPDAGAQVSGQSDLRTWYDSENRLAARAVQALHRAIAPHGGELNAISSGSSDWILFGDPDLERLRAHPQFRRWAGAQWELDSPDAVFGSMSQKLASAKVSDPTARRRPDFWLLIHVRGHAHTLNLIRSGASICAERWRLDGLRVERSLRVGVATEALLLIGKSAVLDLAAWEALAAFDRFAARPDLRLEALRRFRRLAEFQAWLAPVYPSVWEALEQLDLVGRIPRSGLRDGWDGSHLHSLLENGYRFSKERLGQLEEMPIGTEEHKSSGGQLNMLLDICQTAAERWIEVAKGLGPRDAAPA